MKKREQIDAILSLDPNRTDLREALTELQKRLASDSEAPTGMVDEETLAFHQRWSSAGGRTAGLKDATEILMREAGASYVAGKDDQANETRRLAGLVKKLHRVSSNELNRLITEADRRRQASTANRGTATVDSAVARPGARLRAPEHDGEVI